MESFADEEAMFDLGKSRLQVNTTSPSRRIGFGPKEP